jgi:hypothetical protein
LVQRPAPSVRQLVTSPACAHGAGMNGRSFIIVPQLHRGQQLLFPAHQYFPRAISMRRTCCCIQLLCREQIGSGMQHSAASRGNASMWYELARAQRPESTASYCWWRTMARAQHPDRLGDGCPKSERRVHRVSPEPPLWHILKLHAACASQKCHACQAHRQHKQLRPEAKYLWCWWSCETCNSQVRSLKPGVRHPTLLVGGYRLCDLSQAVMEHM